MANRWWPGSMPKAHNHMAAKDEEDEGEMLLHEKQRISRKDMPYSRASFASLFSHAVALFMFISGAVMFWLSSRPCVVSDRQCAQQLSIWSPVLETIQYETHDFTSTLSHDTDIADPYSGPPTPSLEAAWLKLEKMPPVLIPPSHLASLHRTPNASHYLTTSHGFIGTIEVFHHLHCLNALRQWIYRDTYPDGLVPWLLKFNTPEVAREHVGHCLATVRQALMCNADVTPYLWVRGEKGKGAKEDFGAAHKCKTWESVVEGVRRAAVEMPAEAFGDGHAG